MVGFNARLSIGSLLHPRLDRIIISQSQAKAWTASRNNIPFHSFFHQPTSRDWAALPQPYLPPTIASRRPANIPLHTLSNSSRPLTRRPSSSQSDSQDEKARDRRSSDSAGSEFSLWSDTGRSETGDLVDQLADEDDPLHFRANGSLDEEEVGLASRRRGRRTKRVRYHEDTDFSSKEAYSGVPKKKEDIPVPDPQRKPISRGEKLLAIIMAPRDGPSRIHGLHGKKLMYDLDFLASPSRADCL